MSEKSESMIEKVATAIFDVPDIYIKWTEAEALARAAIEAMREPTEEMIDAGADGSGEDSSWVARGAWAAMIDTALGVTHER